MDFPKEIAERFRINGQFIGSKRWGTGNVNDTFLIEFLCSGEPKHYVYQRINHDVFTDPVGLMDNIRRVTNHLISNANRCSTVRLIDTLDGAWFALDGEGNYWRAYEYVENTESPSFARNLTQAYEAAKAFGAFQRELINLPGPPLHETIPEFHHTRKRLDRFMEAVEEDSAGRVVEVAKEIAFIRERRPLAEWFETKESTGELPRRIVHNDTKLNNVMLDCRTGKAVCVIDLDTVMPGIAASDFGDLVRSAAASADEDEKDLSKMGLRMDVFDALARGYLEEAATFLTPAELESLSLAPLVLTLELAVRFLTDYLQGDTYFKTVRHGHNLDRCRAQLKLLSSMEEQETAIREILEKHAMSFA